MRFFNPMFFFLLLFLPLIFWWRSRRSMFVRVLFSDVSVFKRLVDRKVKWLTRLSLILRIVALILIVVALARPQAVGSFRESEKEAVDLMLVLDTSLSMAATDLKPDRMTAAKKALTKFVKKRSGDRIGLIIFGEGAFTQVPLTFDHELLLNLVSPLELGSVGQGTAIGVAMATGLNRLRSSESKSKVMILVTDGENNSGGITPENAAEIAATLGVKIYTIGIGKTEKGSYQLPNGQRFQTRLDEVTLKRIAQKTGGAYFRAVDTDAFSDVYEQIDSLEKTTLKTRENVFVEELFPKLLQWVILLLMLEFFISNFLIVRLP